MHRVPDVRWLHHESRLLANNPMGDPHARTFPVYVPPGYDADSSRGVPAVFLLAGWSGRGARYLEDGGAFSASLPERLDEAILTDAMSPVIVVMPDCATRLGASQYVNSVAVGPYMDYLCDELVPFIDREFRTDARAEARGILGHSSGGFGALVTAMKRPDRFRLVCSSAGDGWYDYLYRAGIPTMIRVIARAGSVEQFIARYLESPNAMGLLSREESETMMNLNMCACYAPNLAVPVLRGDLYFDLSTGAIRPDVWAKFLAWDPVEMVSTHLGALRQMHWIHLESGTDDEYGLHLAHRQFASRLRAHAIAHVVDEYPGRHGGHHYRFASRIARMLSAIRPSRDASSEMTNA